MKKTIIIMCAFLVALSIVTASGQGISSIGGSGSVFLPAPLPSTQGASQAIRTAPKVSTGKDSIQLQNIDLQNTLQKQQQLIQMMSNLLKTLNDTAMSVIRKIGG
jgi:hypothetical protein